MMAANYSCRGDMRQKHMRRLPRNATNENNAFQVRQKRNYTAAHK
jgi:hypothetical protein